MALSEMNRALNQIAKRAEKQDTAKLHETFVDSGVADVLDNVDGQVLYGRRGTGKTHALSYLELEAARRGDVAIRIDLRTVGSPSSIVSTDSGTVGERASRLLVDLLGQLRDDILSAVLNDEELLADDRLVDRADALLAAITSVTVVGDVEVATESEARAADSRDDRLGVTIAASPSLEVGGGAGSQTEERVLERETRRGAEHFTLNFTDVARALGDLADSLLGRRVLLLLDEWSSVPSELQPYLANFLVRCVLPLQKVTVKIAAIEQQTNFLARVDGRRIGIELGADLGANVNLDDFLVFEGSKEQSREFFRGLFFKHLRGTVDEPGVKGLNTPADVVRLGFTDSRAFDELVRAAEGVPRDALYIAGRAAQRAGLGKISVPLVRSAARFWYESDKSRALAGPGLAEANRLLNWIIEKVIREKQARGFLVREGDSRDPLLLSLFDARVLHIVRRGYSAQDHPGDRFDVWVVDYGAYVDLLSTRRAPRDLLLWEAEVGEEDYDETESNKAEHGEAEYGEAEYGEAESDEAEYGDLEVPLQDLRAIRRAVLDLKEFYDAKPSESNPLN